MKLDLVGVDEATTARLDDALEELLGVISQEEVLDLLFSSFCIGK